jgi:TP901 family phage tail tape measure protein
MQLTVTVLPSFNSSQFTSAGNQAGANFANGLNSAISKAQPLGKITGQVSEFEKSMDAANARVLAFGAAAGSIYLIKSAFEKLLISTAQVEKSLAEVNSVLGMSSSSLKSFSSEIFKAASFAGQTFETASKVALEFARQGSNAEETIKRVSAALSLMRVASFTADEAVNSITSALNTFTQEALTAEDVVNRLATVDNNFAVSSRDLANALQRVGSVASDAGIQFNELLGLITAAQTTTARGGAVIGNAFKSIFTRLVRPQTLDDLESVGVRTRDASGKILPMVNILKNLANQYDSLGSSQKSFISESVGGVYQVNILKAALSDLGKNMSIFDRAVSTAQNSTGAMEQRMEDLNQTISSKLNASTNEVTKFFASFGQMAFGTNIKKGLDSVTENLSFINNLLSDIEPDDSKGEQIGKTLAQGITKGIGNVLAGPGVQLAAMLLTKMFVNIGKFAIDASREFMGINGSLKQQQSILSSIETFLSHNPKILQAIKSGQLDLNQAHLIYLKQLETENKIKTQNASIARTMMINASPYIRAEKVSHAAVGELAPTRAQEFRERQLAAADGGYAAGKVILTKDPSHMAGGGMIIANTAEEIVPGVGIIPPTRKVKVGNKNIEVDIRNAATGSIPNIIPPTSKQVSELSTRYPNLSKNINSYNQGQKAQKIHPSDTIYSPQVEIVDFSEFKDPDLLKLLENKEKAYQAGLELSKQIEKRVIILEKKNKINFKSTEKYTNKTNSSLDIVAKSSNIIGEIKSGKVDLTEVQDKFLRFAIENPTSGFYNPFTKSPGDQIKPIKSLQGRLYADTEPSRKKISGIQKIKEQEHAATGIVPNFANPFGGRRSFGNQVDDSYKQEAKLFYRTSIADSRYQRYEQLRAQKVMRSLSPQEEGEIKDFEANPPLFSPNSDGGKIQEAYYAWLKTNKRRSGNFLDEAEIWKYIRGDLSAPAHVPYSDKSLRREEMNAATGIVPNFAVEAQKGISISTNPIIYNLPFPLTEKEKVDPNKVINPKSEDKKKYHQAYEEYVISMLPSKGFDSIENLNSVISGSAEADIFARKNKQPYFIDAKLGVFDPKIYAISDKLTKMKRLVDIPLNLQKLRAPRPQGPILGTDENFINTAVFFGQLKHSELTAGLLEKIQERNPSVIQKTPAMSDKEILKAMESGLVLPGADETGTTKFLFRELSRVAKESGADPRILSGLSKQNPSSILEKIKRKNTDEKALSDIFRNVGGLSEGENLGLDIGKVKKDFSAAYYFAFNNTAAGFVPNFNIKYVDLMDLRGKPTQNQREDLLRDSKHSLEIQEELRSLYKGADYFDLPDGTDPGVFLNQLKELKTKLNSKEYNKEKIDEILKRKYGLRMEMARKSHAATGHIPNFNDAIEAAKKREIAAGHSPQDVMVGYDSRLKNAGLGVFNRGQGSLSNAINQHLALGQTMSELQTQGVKGGAVPNFGIEESLMMGVMSTFLQSGQKMKFLTAGYNQQIEAQNKLISNLDKLAQKLQEIQGGEAFKSGKKKTDERAEVKERKAAYAEEVSKAEKKSGYSLEEGKKIASSVREYENLEAKRRKEEGRQKVLKSTEQEVSSAAQTVKRGEQAAKLQKLNQEIDALKKFRPFDEKKSKPDPISVSKTFRPEFGSTIEEQRRQRDLKLSQLTEERKAVRKDLGIKGKKIDPEKEQRMIEEAVQKVPEATKKLSSAQRKIKGIESQPGISLSEIEERQAAITASLKATTQSKPGRKFTSVQELKKETAPFLSQVSKLERSGAEIAEQERKVAPPPTFLQRVRGIPSTIRSKIEQFDLEAEGRKKMTQFQSRPALSSSRLFQAQGQQEIENLQTFQELAKKVGFQPSKTQVLGQMTKSFASEQFGKAKSFIGQKLEERESLRGLTREEKSAVKEERKIQRQIEKTKQDYQKRYGTNIDDEKAKEIFQQKRTAYEQKVEQTTRNIQNRGMMLSVGGSMAGGIASSAAQAAGFSPDTVKGIDTLTEGVTMAGQAMMAIPGPAGLVVGGFLLVKKAGEAVQDMIGGVEEANKSFENQKEQSEKIISSLNSVGQSFQTLDNLYKSGTATVNQFLQANRQVTEAMNQLSRVSPQLARRFASATTQEERQTIMSEASADEDIKVREKQFKVSYAQQRRRQSVWSLTGLKDEGEELERGRFSLSKKGNTTEDKKTRAALSEASSLAQSQILSKMSKSKNKEEQAFVKEFEKSMSQGYVTPEQIQKMASKVKSSDVASEMDLPADVKAVEQDLVEKLSTLSIPTEKLDEYASHLERQNSLVQLENSLRNKYNQELQNSLNKGAILGEIRNKQAEQQLQEQDRRAGVEATQGEAEIGLQSLVSSQSDIITARGKLKNEQIEREGASKESKIKLQYGSSTFEKVSKIFTGESASAESFSKQRAGAEMFAGAPSETSQQISRFFEKRSKEFSGAEGAKKLAETRPEDLAKTIMGDRVYGELDPKVFDNLYTQLDTLSKSPDFQKQANGLLSDILNNAQETKANAEKNAINTQAALKEMNFKELSQALGGLSLLDKGGERKMRREIKRAETLYQYGTTEQSRARGARTLLNLMPESQRKGELGTALFKTVEAGMIAANRNVLSGTLLGKSGVMGSVEQMAFAQTYGGIKGGNISQERLRQAGLTMGTGEEAAASLGIDMSGMNASVTNASEKLNKFTISIEGIGQSLESLKRSLEYTRGQLESEKAQLEQFRRSAARPAQQNPEAQNTVTQTPNPQQATANTSTTTNTSNSQQSEAIASSQNNNNQANKDNTLNNSKSDVSNLANLGPAIESLATATSALVAVTNNIRNNPQVVT